MFRYPSSTYLKILIQSQFYTLNIQIKAVMWEMLRVAESPFSGLNKENTHICYLLNVPQ